MPSYYVPLPAFRAPEGIDFKPLNDAFDGWQKANQFNAMLALRQKGEERASEEHGWQREKHQQGAQDRKAKALGAAAQSILAMPQDQRQRALQAWRAMDKDFDADLSGAGFEPNDIDTWGPLIIAKSRGVQDPLEIEKTQADIDYTRARAGYYRGGGAGAGGGRLSADERIAERYMEEDDNLTWSEALAMARRRPSDDTRRESLAARNARDGLEPAEVEPWRERYGVGQPAARPQARRQQPGDANRFDFSGRMRGNVDQQGLLDEAREAIRKGANPETVRRRLQDEYGIDGSGL